MRKRTAPRANWWIPMRLQSSGADERGNKSDPADGGSLHTSSPPAEREINAALEAIRRSAPAEIDHIIPEVYAELRRIAHRQLASEATGHTLSTTALVNEAYLRLSDQRQRGWQSSSQFLVIASLVMRRILIDYARRYSAQRRGGTAKPIMLSLDAPDGSVMIPVKERSDELLALDEALECLSRIDPRAARVVECRFFGGLSEPETAAALNVSVRTVSGDWRMARAWLYQQLQASDP